MPWPLTDGGAIGIFNITKSLAELGHEITLVTYPLDYPEETKEGLTALSKYARVEIVSKPLPARWRVLFRTMFRGAYPIERRMMPEMYALLERIVESTRFDVVHVDHAHMGEYGLWLKAKHHLPILLREHNFEALIYERFAKTERNLFKRLIATIHGRRLKRQESKYLNAFDAIAAITNEDADIIRHVAPAAKIEVIPAGVDTDYFHPSEAPEDPDQILWIGSLAWDPNFDAIRYFLTSIFPLILKKRSTAKFDIIGTDASRLQRQASTFGANVRLLGRVPDVRDYLARSAVLVVPLRIGGGMRLKLLDFFAAGKAVVSTSIGVEGNLAKNAQQLLLADDPLAFANATVELLSNAELRAQFGRTARELVMQKYNWKKIGEDFSKLYTSILSFNREASRTPSI